MSKESLRIIGMHLCMFFLFLVPVFLMAPSFVDGNIYGYIFTYLGAVILYCGHLLVTLMALIHAHEDGKKQGRKQMAEETREHLKTVQDALAGQPIAVPAYCGDNGDFHAPHFYEIQQGKAYCAGKDI